MSRIARTALILILLAAVPMTLAAVLSLDLSIGDSGVMTCTGQLVSVTAEPGQITADCVELETATPMPEPTATATPTITPTATVTATAVNLLINPEFGHVDVNECSGSGSSTILHWQSAYTWANHPWPDAPTTSQCAIKLARLNSSPGNGDLIPVGETGYVSQVVTVTADFDTIHFELWYSQHETGENGLVIEVDEGEGFSTVADSGAYDVPQVQVKSVCDIYAGTLAVNDDGTAVWSVDFADPGQCSGSLPGDISFSGVAFDGSLVTHIRVTIYVTPASSGPSAIKAAYAELRID